MLEIAIPGAPTLRLAHLLLDYNGTLACRGMLVEGVSERLSRLARHLEIHVLTADTFGTAHRQVARLPVSLAVIPPDHQAEAKAAHLRRLGAGQAAAIGNGRNDRLMLQEAALGIAVLQGEGAARETLLAAQVVALNILEALDLLLHPDSLRATLRT
ncbi:MAG: ATPase P [Deltaproteobacteria bacterium]|nr:ATPase P [Deltaproteobacteria bacterium]